MRISKEEKKNTIGRIMAILREAQHVYIWDVLSAVQLPNDVGGKLLFHTAVERLRKEKIIYGAMARHPFHYERKEGAQVIGMAGRQRRAGMRKVERAAEKLRVVEETSEDKATAERAGRLAARYEEQKLRRRGF